MRRALSLCCLLVAMLAWTGCGSGGDQDRTSGGSGTDGTPTISITIKNGTVQPDGTEVKVEKGKPIKLRITSDADGELHVHSSPEREIPYHPGTTRKTLTIDQPGVVDIEDHHLDKLVVQLQVS